MPPTPALQERVSTPTATDLRATPTALENSRPPLSTRAPVLPTQTLATTPTPSMEGEREAIQKVSQALILGGGFHYKQTLEECKEAIKNKELMSCSTINSVKQLEFPSWEQAFPQAPLFLVEIEGYNQYWERGIFQDLLAIRGERYYRETDFRSSVERVRVVVQ